MRLDSFDLDLRYDDPTYIAWYIEPKGRYYSSKVDLVAANIVQNETIELAWLPVKDAKKYIIYRSNKKSGGFKKIKTVNRAWYVDRKANAGNVYYKVKAVGAKTKASKVVRVMRKLKNPDYSIEYDSQGYPIVTWDKVRGAKLYALYSSDYLKKKYMKTIKTNKYKFKTAKQSDSHYMVVPMIKKGSKANGSGTYIYADRKILAPKMKFVSDDDIGAEFTIIIDQDLGWLKGKKIWVTLERSESSKDGGYLDASTKILRTGSNGKFKFDYKKEFNMKDELGRGMEKDRYYRVVINWNNEYGYKKSGFTSDPILVKAAS